MSKDYFVIIIKIGGPRKLRAVGSNTDSGSKIRVSIIIIHVLQIIIIKIKKHLESFPKNIKVAYLFNFFSIFNHCLENFQGNLFGFTF
jgi:hypothetical protein